MTDYMKEAFETWFKHQIWGNEDFKTCLSEAWQAALLAHIQRGEVPEGWRDAVQKLGNLTSFLAGWQLSESCIRNDMGSEVSRWIDGLSELYKLYAAPAPDQFRDAAEMVAEKPCVETFDADFLARLGAEVPTPAEVPMPEPIGFIDSDDDETWATLTQNAHELATLKLRSAVFHVSQMRTYGAACRAAGEAAGYARGLAEAGRDAKEWGNALNDAGWAFDSAYHRHMGEPTPPRLFNTAKAILRDSIIAYTAALRGEVKP